MSGRTIPQMFQDIIGQHSAKAALMYKKNGQYHSLTYKQVGDDIQKIASALIEFGIEMGDRVALLSENCPEWVVSDQAVMHAGAINVPIYPTLTPAQIAYILNDCGAKIVIVSKNDLLKKILEISADVATLTHVIIRDTPDTTLPKASIPVLHYAQVLEQGAKLIERHWPSALERIAQGKREDVATIVYTSGTTGDPKGAMLMHLNIMSNIEVVAPLAYMQTSDVQLSFLPLCHVFERIAYYGMISVGATIAYAESVDTVANNLIEIKPTVMPSVPRLFEKIQAKILANVEQGPNWKKKVFFWAIEVGKRCLALEQAGKPVTGLLALQRKIADKMAFSKIRARTGGNIRYFISGGAALNKDIGEFFQIAGLTIIEGYGLTETSPVITFNPPERPKFGTVGKAIPHVEVRLAEDGEILAKGPNIMKGYWNAPDKTREVIDEDGWFHTGDIGRFDEDGYLVITDRKKEIIVMSNGKNVAPQPIEALLKASKYIEQACLIGDSRNYMTALIVPNLDQLKSFAKGRNLKGDDLDALILHRAISELIQKEVDQVNGQIARYEQLKKFKLLTEEFTPENGMLTPTLKFKRRIISNLYEAEIDAMYAEQPVGAAT